MKKVMIIAAAMMTANAYALDVQVGDESFELNTNTIATVEANIDTVDSMIDANAVDAFNAIDRTINSAESLDKALEQAVSDQNGDLNAAISQVADAAAVGATNGHSAEQVMDTSKGHKVEK